MNKKALKEITKKYFEDNSRFLGTFFFILLLMLLLFILLNGGKIGAEFLILLASIALFFVTIYWKVFYLKIIIAKDLKHNSFEKKNITFVDVKEDKSWIFWNSSPKAASAYKYFLYDESGDVYRIATTCNYQDLEALKKFLSSQAFKVVVLEKSRLIVSIQANPSQYKDSKTKKTQKETVKNLFYPFSSEFSYKDE